MLVRNREELSCDVLVIGGGGAGLRAAIAAKRTNADVLLVSKTKVGFNSNTYISKALIASTGWGTPDDDASAHLADTVYGGRFLNDQSMAAKVAERSHAEITFLRECGVHFDVHAGTPRVMKTPGHRYPRHVYGENWCGSDLVLPIKRRAQQMGVRFAEHLFVTRLIADKNRIGGAAGVTAGGCFYGIGAKVVVLATGGYAQIYLNTNNVPGITGDGQALAYDLGMPLKDMEFVQFYPTATGKRGNRLILYERLLAQPDVALRDASGKNILNQHGIADATTLTRDRLAQLIFKAMNRGDFPDNGVYMDMAALSREKARQLKPLLPARWWQGQKVFKVAPTAHFCMGGIVTNQQGETPVEGLFAVGEATAGAHGANRLGGNALAEIFTMGSWVGEVAAERSKNVGPASGQKKAFKKEQSRLDGFYSMEGVSVKKLTNELKQLMWNTAGVIRHQRSLQEALERLREPHLQIVVANPKDLIRLLEFQNMRCVATLVCRAALERTESRGSHFRSDYPQEDNKRWIKNIVLRKTNTDLVLEKTPVVWI
jgi:succinate dehydrogenase/fumarate reductase flavoprotein subunit